MELNNKELYQLANIPIPTVTPLHRYMNYSLLVLIFNDNTVINVMCEGDHYEASNVFTYRDFEEELKLNNMEIHEMYHEDEKIEKYIKEVFPNIKKIYIGEL